MTVHVLPEIGDAPIFRNRLEDRDKAIVDSLGFVLKRYPQNAVINSRADAEHRVFIIHSGWGCLYNGLPDGDRQIVDFPLPGDVILARSYESDASELLIALTELLVFEAPAKALEEGLENSPRASVALLSAAARQRAVLAQHLTNVGRRRALLRVAHFLLEFAVRLERVGGATREGYKLPLTQYDLADALGLTAIHVNRVLRELRERKFVEFRQSTVRFLDRERLERFAGFDSAYLM